VSVISGPTYNRSALVRILTMTVFGQFSHMGAPVG